ncbi:GPI mannosyltransferase 2 [Phlebotomus argentipes]|uniref:GPI mannosyltransferase 2 n=1 Tax=Phlebotomus argentipes TaxID=94469 RepID=UPI0028937166|nr:GPI mannosyltransferase 2 [Phlebotomus argentipes]
MQISIQQIAIASRLALINIQFLSNLIFPDHNAGVFESPVAPEQAGQLDWLVESFLGGFRRWDGQYFLHIAEYGYTYENTLAFFPLFPLCIRAIAHCLLYLLPVLSLRSTLLLVAVCLNVFFFMKAVQSLYDLSCRVLGQKSRAKIVVFLFCFNPASVFFSAPYTESLFAWLTFTVMNQCVQDISVSIAFPLSLSILCRSNGLLNIGFLCYFALRRIIRDLSVRTFLGVVLKSAVISFFVVFHFGLLQAYHFYLFCHQLNIKFPAHVVSHAQAMNFTLAGNKTDLSSPWCAQKIPMAYSFVQSHYWDVGFLRYYELKQLPNFLLAMPVVIVICSKFLHYVRHHRSYATRLGIFVSDALLKTMRRTDVEIFVFVMHATLLTLFCVLFIHVQVTTRMLASASPILYWTVAETFRYVRSTTPQDVARQSIHSKLSGSVHNIDEETDMIDLAFLEHCWSEESNVSGRYLVVWFFFYFYAGTILFSNNFPWT